MSLTDPDPKARSEEDRVNTRKLTGIGVAALVIFAVAIAASYRWQRFGERTDQPQGPPGIPAEVREEQVGIVYQRTFDQLAPADGVSLHARQREQLSRYGWVDRGKGKVRIPIDQAMQAYLEGRRP